MKYPYTNLFYDGSDADSFTYPPLREDEGPRQNHYYHEKGKVIKVKDKGYTVYPQFDGKPGLEIACEDLVLSAAKDKPWIIVNGVDEAKDFLKSVHFTMKFDDDGILWLGDDEFIIKASGYFTLEQSTIGTYFKAKKGRKYGVMLFSPCQIFRFRIG